MKPLLAQLFARALVLSGVPVYDGRVKSEDVRKLVEASDEIEVDFQHEGKNWVAVFEVISPGQKPGGTEPETHDPGAAPEVQLADFYLKADPTADVDPPALSDEKLEELADKAAGRVADQETTAGATWQPCTDRRYQQLSDDEGWDDTLITDMGGQMEYLERYKLMAIVVPSVEDGNVTEGYTYIIVDLDTGEIIDMAETAYPTMEAAKKGAEGNKEFKL